MSKMSSKPNELTRLRDALGSGDRDAVARGLQRLPVAVGLDGSLPCIAAVGERRQLPIFLDMESWRTFGLPGEPLLMGHAKLLALLEALAHVDDVLVDPALPTALQIPRTDLVQLLRTPPAPAVAKTGFGGTATAERSVWLTDMNGAMIEDDRLIERFAVLYDALPGSDEEHTTLSVTDSDEWNLEFTAGSVLLENVGQGGEEVGSLMVTDRSQAVAIVSEFLVGDFGALRGRPWGCERGYSS